MGSVGPPRADASPTPPRADLDRIWPYIPGRHRAEIAREPGGPSPYDEAMVALALGDRQGAVRALGRSLERHELLGLDPGPGCSPVFDPLYPLDSFRRLLARYDIRVCGR